MNPAGLGVPGLRKATVGERLLIHPVNRGRLSLAAARPVMAARILPVNLTGPPISESLRALGSVRRRRFLAA